MSFKFFIFTIVMVFLPQFSYQVTEIFSLIKERLDLAPDVARTKYKGCKAIEDIVRETEVLKKLVDAGTNSTYSLTKEVVESFFEAQITASKMIQYESVIAADAAFKTRKITPLEQIRENINALDLKLLTSLKGSIEEFTKNAKDRDSCLGTIKTAIEHVKDFPFITAFQQATSFFVDICLKAPVCKAVDPQLH